MSPVVAAGLARLRGWLIARGLGSGIDTSAPHQRPPVRAPEPGLLGTLRVPHGPTFDRKRAAAGERADD